LKAVLALLTL